MWREFFSANHKAKLDMSNEISDYYWSSLFIRSRLTCDPRVCCCAHCICLKWNHCLDIWSSEGCHNYSRILSRSILGLQSLTHSWKPRSDLLCSPCGCYGCDGSIYLLRKRVGSQSYNSTRHFSSQYRGEKNFSYSDEICTHRLSSPFFFSFFHLNWLGTQHTFWTAKKKHSIPSVCPIFSSRPPENPALWGYVVNEGYIHQKKNNEEIVDSTQTHHSLSPGKITDIHNYDDTF